MLPFSDDEGTMKSINFWDITPCSLLSVNRRFGGTCHLLVCWFLDELISSTLKMEAICSSETLVDAQRTTWRYIPEVDTLHNHCSENLKSYMKALCSSETLVSTRRTTQCHRLEDHNLNNHCYENFEMYMKFEVLTAVVMKSSVFWNIMQCSPLKVD
jgi:hypothetical protein